jgi:hypothetical protein
MGESSGARRRRIASLIVSLAATLLLAGPSTLAYAHYTQQLTYATGVYGVNGTYSTPGYDHRQYNQVWHQIGKLWSVYYWTGSETAGYELSSGNPTRWPGEIGYAIARCHNHTDDSGVQWTCQTTT